MATRKKLTPGGIAWLVLLALPPVIIISGLIAMFAWQASRGGVTPKWHKPSPATNAAAPSNSVPSTP